MAALWILGVSTAAALAGCEHETSFAPASDVPNQAGAGGLAAHGPRDCGATKATGCACEPEGAQVDCGDVTHREGDYVSCSKGTRTCEEGVWGPCLGETFGAAFHLGPKALVPGPCLYNPCDPTCQEYDDGPGFVPDADAGVVSTGNHGVTLKGTIGSKGSPCTGLTVTPPSVAMTVTSIPTSGMLTSANVTATPAAAFTAQFIPSGCYVGNAPAVWTTDRPDISTITSAGVFALANPVPGSIAVVAHTGALEASGTVGVVVDAVDETKAPTGVTNTTYTSATPTVADSIQVLYPYAGTVFPLGQIPPVIQWDNLGTAASSVRVQLRYPAGSGPYTFRWSGVAAEGQPIPLLPPAATPAIGAAPRAIIPQAVWAAFEQAAKGNDGEIVVQRRVGTTVRLPNPAVAIHFATARLKGTVYYQSYGTDLVHNYSPSYAGGAFGGATLGIKPGNAAPVLVAGSGAKCVVCHVVSAGGTYLVTQDGGNYNQSIGYDLTGSGYANLGTGNALFAWGALAPDGKHIFTNSGPLPGTTNSAVSKLYNTPSGTAVTVSGLPSIQARTPAFSPDERHVAYQYYGGSCKAGGNTCSAGTDCCSTTCSALKGAAATCAAGSECASGNCAACAGTSSACSTGTDCCSGTCTAYLGAAASCSTSSQCASGNCAACAAAKAACATGTDCCSNTCSALLGAGATCSSGAQCASGTCTSTKCVGGTAGKYCVGGVAGKQCLGGTAKSLCNGGVAGVQCVGGVAGSYCVGGATGDAKSLAEIDYDPVTFTFSNPRTLATPGVGGVGTGAAFYPQFLPNNAGIVWELETKLSTMAYDATGGATRSGCDSKGPIACQDEGVHAELWWTDVATKTSARLDQMNGKGYLPLHPTYTTADDGTKGGGVEATSGYSTADPQFNYEPTVLPKAAGGYTWVVFSSRRRYGNIATMNPFWSDPRWQDLSAAKAATKGVTPKKLWVAAIDANAAPGTDPSHPAFYLEGQELLAGNSRAYWVLDPCLSVGSSCSETADCCPAAAGGPAVTCALDAPPATSRHCSTGGTSACVNDGQACTSDLQCCGFPSSVCAQGKCQVPVVPMTYTPGSFHVDYEADVCPPGTTAWWTDVGIKALFPPSGGTYPAINVYAQFGLSTSDLWPQTPGLVGTIHGPPADQSAAWTNLVVEALYSEHPIIRLTFELIPTADQLAPPALLEWRARFDCVATL